MVGLVKPWRALEAVAAVEIAATMGDADSNDMCRCITIAERLVALLTGLIR